MVAVPNEIVSALIGAASGGGVSYWTYRGTVAQQRNREIREQLLKIVELRQQQGEIDAAPPANYIAVATWINTKRGIHLAIANDLSEKAHRSMTPHDCMNLGWECQQDRNSEAARTHFERAVRKAKKSSVVDLVVALRYLANYYFDTGPDQDVEKGSRCYQDALALTLRETAPYLVYTTGVTYERWASWLASIGDPRWRETAENAKATYERLPVDFSYRKDSLLAVDRLLERPAASPPAGPPPGLAQKPAQDVTAAGTDGPSGGYSS